MPISPINSVSFQKRYTPNEQEIIDVDYRIIDENEQGGYDAFESIGDIQEKNNYPITRREANEIIEQAKEKADSNVHMLTVIVGALTALFTASKGKKAIDIGSKVTTTIGETISSWAVKKGTAALNVLKKNKIDPTNALNKIEEISNKLRSDKPTQALDNVVSVSKKIVGEDKGEKFKEYLVKHNIVNGTNMVNALAATLIAFFAGDKISDKTEKCCDVRDIKEVVKNVSQLIIEEA